MNTKRIVYFIAVSLSAILSLCYVVSSEADKLEIRVDTMDKFMSLLIEHEALKLRPYYDTVKKLTIGIGRNLTDKGITADEAMYLAKNDIAVSRMELGHYDWYNQLDQVRKDVLVELHFNIGLTKLLKFRQMIGAIERQDYKSASMHLLNSKWRTDVGERRSSNMAKRLETGMY